MSTTIIKIVSDVGFNFKAPIEVEESTPFRAIIKGVLLREGLSRNNHLYTIDEMENIASQCENLPIEYGVTTKPDPNTGILKKDMHAHSPRVGRIIRAWLDKATRKIHYIAEVYGRIARRIKKGWGVSIDGKSLNARYVLTKAGKVVLHIRDLVLRKLQLLPPTVKSGVIGASVESVEIEESMSFEATGLLSPRTVSVITALYEEGLL